jgi:ribonuclease HI
MKVIIHTDGASRGNPGDASVGVVIESENGKKEYSQAIGKQTNNVAEYSAVIFALKKSKLLFGSAKAKTLEILINADSKLVVEQLSGNYKLKNEGIQKLFIEVWNLRLDFKKVEFKYIPREQNKDADRLANEALDGLNKQLF